MNTNGNLIDCPDRLAEVLEWLALVPTIALAVTIVLAGCVPPAVPSPVLPSTVTATLAPPTLTATPDFSLYPHGLFSLAFPTGQPYRYCFSQGEDAGSSVPFPDCADEVAQPDLTISYKSMEAPHGIVDLGPLDVPAPTPVPPLLNISQEERVTGYEEELVAKQRYYARNLAVHIESIPDDGYAASVPFPNGAADHLFVLRASEGQHVLLTVTEFYMGALDHLTFFWMLVEG